MELEQVLHMNGGDCNTSYANNSLLQRTVISMVKPILEESIEKLCDTNFPECLKIGDFGCSAGPNTLLVVSHIIDKVQKMCLKLNQQPPQFQVFLNDLPGNDFNALFRLLPDFYQKMNKDKEKSAVSCFIAGVPGSFYGRLFPNNSLHFAHSSYAIITWLSKIPEDLVSEKGEDVNKGFITITKQSPPAVHKAYYKQFKKDFSMFLRCRAQELVTNGSMVLLITGTFKSYDPQILFEFAGLKLKDMVQEGLVEEKKLDSFNMPYYAATLEEVKEVVEVEGSFTLQKLEAFPMDWDAHIKMADSSLNEQQRATKLTGIVRAAGEPILSSHFGQEIMDDLFRRFEEGVLDHITKEKFQFITFVIYLTKKG